jgi:hypothetical protein
MVRKVIECDFVQLIYEDSKVSVPFSGLIEERGRNHISFISIVFEIQYAKIALGVDLSLNEFFIYFLILDQIIVYRLETHDVYV